MLLRSELLGSAITTPSDTLPASAYAALAGGSGTGSWGSGGYDDGDDDVDMLTGGLPPSENATDGGCESAIMNVLMHVVTVCCVATAGTPTRNLLKFQSPPRTALHPTDIVKRFSLSPLGTASER